MFKSTLIRKIAFPLMIIALCLVSVLVRKMQTSVVYALLPCNIDGVISGYETCEDGNEIGGDGCSDTCKKECDTSDDCSVGYVGICSENSQAYFSGICNGGICGTTPLSGCGTEFGSCADMIDNDGDDSAPGDSTDCNDSDCCGFDANCNGVGGCASAIETICDDFLDNDFDGYIDCADSDCSGDPSCSGAPVCGDGNPELPETCDDGNSDNTDSCPDGVGGTCITATCGDGFICSSAGCTTGPSSGPEACEQNSDCNVGAGETCVSCECVASGVSVCGDGNIDAGETCSNCPYDVYDDVTSGCSASEKCINDSCVDRAGICSLEDVCGDGIVGPNEQCDDGGICMGSTLFEGQNCSTIGSGLHDGVKRCRATGGWCVAQDGDGCTWDCRQCTPTGAPCFLDVDCCGGSCTNGVCA